MNFYLRNKLIITDYTKEMLEYCNQHLSFDNPDYIKKEAMGKWTGNTPRKMVLFEQRPDTLILPFGVAMQVYKAFKDKISFIKPIFATIREREYKSSIKTYEYQERGIQAILRHKNGILVAPCGSGKTQMGLEAIARIGGKALWITHTKDLLNQSLERARGLFDIKPNEFGTITDGKINIGNTITFSTVQTLANIDLKEKELIDEWDIIVVDECHKAVGSPTQMMMFYKVLSQLAARYKIGLTATPYRADGLQKCMFAILGDIVYEVPKSAVKDTTCKVKVEFVDTEFAPDIDVITAGDGTLVYASLVDNIIKDQKRNEKIIERIQGIDGATMLLSDRIEHLNLLYNALPDADKAKCVVISGQGQTKKAKDERKKALKMLDKGEIKYIFATYKLAKEGLDVPNLRYVVFATPQKDKTTVIQSAGRVGRKAEDKEFGTVIDFCDNFGMLRGYEKKRKGYYKSLGYEF